MRTAICTLAKMENAYIAEWVRYHLQAGFGHIFIYDNNLPGYAPLADCIAADLAERVTIVDWRSRQFSGHTPNVEVYNDWLTTNADNYDWCAFVDVDEFIRLGRPLEDVLGGVPEIFDAMLLNWHVIGDSGIIEGDESVAVQERLTVGVSTTDSFLFKTILRCRPEMRAMNPSTFALDETLFTVPYCDCNYLAPLMTNSQLITLDEYDCWIDHYATKTLAEFLKYKMPRLNGEHFGTGLDYFYRYNERTPEKDAYAEAWFENLNQDLNED